MQENNDKLLDPSKRTVETWLQLIDNKISQQNTEIAVMKKEIHYLNDSLNKIRAAQWKVIGLALGLGLILGYVFNEIKQIIEVIPLK